MSSIRFYLAGVLLAAIEPALKLPRNPHSNGRTSILCVTDVPWSISGHVSRSRNRHLDRRTDFPPPPYDSRFGASCPRRLSFVHRVARPSPFLR